MEVREVLVPHPVDDVRVGKEDERAELVAAVRELQLVHVRERDDQVDVVEADELGELRDVPVLFDPRNERVAVGGVERGGVAVDVGGDRRRPGLAEGPDDVDAHPGAGEEHGRHGARA